MSDLWESLGYGPTKPTAPPTTPAPTSGGSVWRALGYEDDSTPEETESPSLLSRAGSALGTALGSQKHYGVDYLFRKSAELQGLPQSEDADAGSLLQAAVLPPDLPGDLPNGPTPASYAKSIAGRGIKLAANMAWDPVTWETAGLGGVAGKAAGAAFTGLAAKGAVDAAKAGYQRYLAEGLSPEVAADAFDAAASAGFAGLGARHLAGGNAPAPVEQGRPVRQFTSEPFPEAATQATYAPPVPEPFPTVRAQPAAVIASPEPAPFPETAISEIREPLVAEPAPFPADGRAQIGSQFAAEAPPFSERGMAWPPEDSTRVAPIAPEPAPFPEQAPLAAATLEPEPTPASRQDSVPAPFEPATDTIPADYVPPVEETPGPLGTRKGDRRQIQEDIGGSAAGADTVGDQAVPATPGSAGEGLPTDSAELAASIAEPGPRVLPGSKDLDAKYDELARLEHIGRAQTRNLSTADATALAIRRANLRKEILASEAAGAKRTTPFLFDRAAALKRLGAEGEAKYATAEGAPKPPNREAVRSKLRDIFKGQRVEDAESGGFVVKTPSGKTITIEPTGEISFGENLAQHGPEVKASVEAGERRIAGSMQTVGNDALVRIVDEGVLPHEIGGHVFLEHFAEPREAAFIEKEWTKRAESEGKGRSFDEVFADDYNQWWDGRKAPSSALQRVFTRIRDFFERTKRSLGFESREALFREIESSRPFDRAEPRTIRPIPPGAKPPAYAVSAVPEPTQGDLFERQMSSVEPKEPTLGDKLYEGWINGMLSAPSTNIAKGASDIASLVGTGIERGAASIADAARSKWTGSPRERYAGEMWAHFGGMKAALSDALANGKKAWNEERVPILENGSPIDTGHAPYAIGGKLGKVIRAGYGGGGTRGLRAIDAFSKTLAIGAEKYTQALRIASQEGGTVADVSTRAREIASTPDSELWKLLGPKKAGAMLENMDAYMKRATFTADFSKGMEAAVKFRNSVPFGRVVVPFMKVPWNLGVEGYKATPLNFLNILQKVRAGELKGGALSEALVRPILGTTLMMSVAALAADGKVSGNGPDDPEDRKAWLAAGNVPYAINTPNGWVSYKKLEPFSKIIGLAADLAHTRDQPDAKAKASAAIGAFEAAFTQASFLSGLEEMGGILKDPIRYGGNYAKQLATSVVPNIVSKAAQAIDPTIRDTKQSLLAPLEAKIPGLSQTLPAVKAPAGEDAMRGGTALERLVSPFPRGVAGPNAELEQKLADVHAAPSTPKRELQFKYGTSSAKVPLTDQEYALFNAADANTTKRLEALARSPSFKAASDDRQKELIDKAYTEGRSQVRNRILASSAFRQRAASQLRAQKPPTRAEKSS